MADEQKKYGATNDEIMEFLQENMVTREEFNVVKETMVTKDELKNEIGKLRSDMIDFISKENLNMKADIVTMLKTEDQKIVALIQVLVNKNVISDLEAKAISKIDPFHHRAVA